MTPQAQTNIRHKLQMPKILNIQYSISYLITFISALAKFYTNPYKIISWNFALKDENNCHNWLTAQNHRILLPETLSLGQTISISQVLKKHGMISSALFLGPQLWKKCSFSSHLSVLIIQTQAAASLTKTYYAKTRGSLKQLSARNIINGTITQKCTSLGPREVSYHWKWY
jgi:hypothetical protein